MKILAIIVVATILIVNTICIINGIKHDKNVWEI